MTNQLLENEKLGALTLEDLVFFVTLCEELSLSETAKRCSLSLSGASRTMKKLREVFDDKLFLRSMPDSIATERALELYPLVSDIVERAGALTHSAVCCSGFNGKGRTGHGLSPHESFFGDVCGLNA